MKKLYQFSFLIAFILLFGVNSCKKEAKDTVPTPAKVADTHVKPEEINAWFDKMPQVKPSATLLAAAQQAVINGVQVVRIPVGYNAALYFTKENDSLKVYAYKWIYQNFDAEKYTGYIDAYNFQNQNLTRLTYANGKLVNTLPLAHYTEQAVTVNSDGRLKVNTECFITVIFNAIWDWITNHFSGEGSNVGSGGGDFSSYMNSFGYSASNYSGTGFTTVGGSSGGGGITWGPPPCPPTASQLSESIHLKVNKVDPNDPSNPPPAPSCVVVTTTQWYAYIFTTTGQSCTQIMCRDTSITNNYRLNRIFDFLDGRNQVFDSLSAAYKTSYKYDLKFFQTDPNKNNANSYTQFIPNRYSSANATAFVNLSRTFVSDNINSKYIDIVRSILHETWHTELYQRLQSTYSTTDLDVIKSKYSLLNLSDLTAVQLIDLLNVDRNGNRYLFSVYIKSINGLDDIQQHNYMVKNISILAKGINQFLITINSPLKNNMEFAYAEALSQLRPVSTYFQDTNNILEFLPYFPGYTDHTISLSQYIDTVYTINVNNVGPLP